MEEVRSYWQVASIQHFCTLFQKPFKLPLFEPEELEQAFIIDVPEPIKSNSIFSNNINHINDTNDADKLDSDITNRQQNGDDNGDDDQVEGQERLNSRKSSYDYDPSSENGLQTLSTLSNQHQQQNGDQQELHLLVKLAIALLKPHFNCKISSSNWENYLRRLIDMNWVELEHCPSPLSIPIISPDGIELTKCLNFRDLPISDKIDVFFALCDYRLWCEDATELLKDYPMDELRLESIGKDSHGYEYWYFSGTRLFRENSEISQDLICRKKRIKELEYKLIELEKSRILKEQEDRRRAELEKAKQLANEAREARLAAKRQMDQETAAATSGRKKRASNTPVLPPRTGLRERRSSSAGNNNESQATPARTLRSRAKPQVEAELSTPQSTPKTRAKNSRQNELTERIKASSPDLPKRSSEEECREELEQIAIKREERFEAWCIACESLEQWEDFAKKFEKTKSTNEKYLASHLNNHLLPHIQGIYAKRAAEIKRKERELLLSLATRRVSTRIISKRAQEEEEERQALLRETEIQKKKTEAETRLRAELEREIRAKKSRFVVSGENSSACSDDGEDTSGRYNLRQQQHQQHATSEDLSEFDGIIHPDKLAEFYEALELIVDTVRTSKHAWPFVDAVPDIVPGYYDLIKEPMDLKTLRTKVEFRHYKSLIELEKDFQLLVNNCERFNGPKNVYTKMVYKLWKSFRKNVLLYLQRDLHMDEYETFLYPPVPQVPPPIGDDSTRMDNVHNGVEIESESKSQQNNSHKQLDNIKTDRIVCNGETINHNNDSKNDINFVKDTDQCKQVDCSLKPEGPFESENQISDLHTWITAKQPEPNLQFQPTPLELPIEFIGDDSDIPPEPVCEEVIIESFVEPIEDNLSVHREESKDLQVDQ